MSKLFESLKLIWKSGSYKTSTTEVDDEIPVVGDQLTSQEVLDLIRRAKEISSDRKQRKEYYEYMTKDAIVSGCVELIADECCVRDDNRGLSFWVDCPTNKGFEQAINQWLRELILSENLDWRMTYQLLVYGEFFLRTFDTPSVDCSDDIQKGLFTVGDYFELMSSDYKILDLRLYGKTLGFQVENPIDEADLKIYKSTEFIHAMIDKGEKENLKVELLDETTGEKILKNVQVRYGTSYLESSRQSFAILDLIDSMLLSTRVNRTQLIRLIMVEVGNSNTKETKKILNRVELAFKNSSIECEKSYKEGDKSSTIQNVFIPRRNNKGEITVDQIGGDSDIRDIADIEYYTDKFMASMRIPKAFVGMDSNITSGLGINTMTKVDIRYARLIISIKNIIKETLVKMIQFKLSQDSELTGMLGDSEWTIETVPVSSSEEDEKLASLTTAVSASDQIKSLFQESESYDVEAILDYLVKYIINLPDFEDTKKSKTTDKKGDGK